jgi:GT2 family glycosyltransferase
MSSFSRQKIKGRLFGDRCELGRCDVVIVNFNASAFLTEALESVLRSRLVAHVYVVDNASTDQSLELLLPRQGHRLTIIRNATNLGFATACNLGLVRATSENVLVLNPDCLVMEDAIDHLISALRSADCIGMVGPLLLNLDGSEQAGGRRRFPTPQLVFWRAIGAARLQWLFPFRLPDFLLHREPLPQAPVEVEAISGACMLVRREMIADIGPFDEEYFLHSEDLDWCMRAWRGGWRILFVPDAKVIHHKGVSGRNRPLLVEYYKHKGMILFYRKLLGDAHSRLFLALVATMVWIRFGGVVVGHGLSQTSERMRGMFWPVSKDRQL